MSSDENKQEQPATEKKEPAEQEEKDVKKNIEKEQEAKLRAKYPGLNKPHGGSSAFLQKRLSKGQKYFDSGDYAMAKADGSKKKPLPPADKLLIGSRGDAIPTPENLPPRKPSLVQSKLAAGMS